MNFNKKRSPKSSYYFHLVAGVYLLYIDYSLISSWQEIEEKNKIFMIIVSIIFAISATFIIVRALKGLKDIKDNPEEITEETEEIVDEIEEITEEIEEIKKTES